MPASIDFIFGDDEKYRGKVRAAYPFPGKKTNEQYEAFLDMLRDRGIDVDDGTYDYHTFSKMNTTSGKRKIEKQLKKHQKINSGTGRI